MTKLNDAIQRAISNEGILKLKGNDMADDAKKKIEDARKKEEEANQKLVDARDGNVVSSISAFGSPSTHEDPNDPRSKSIAQLPEEGDAPKQDERFDQDQESLAQVEVDRAEEAVANAEAAVAEAQAEAKATDSKVSKDDK